MMGCRLRVECVVLNRVAREGSTWKVTFEQKRMREGSRGNIWEGRLFGAAEQTLRHRVNRPSGTRCWGTPVWRAMGNELLGDGRERGCHSEKFFLPIPELGPILASRA